MLRNLGKRTIDERRQVRGQAVLELTIVTPLLIMLTIVAINFGGWLYCWTQIGNAARTVANYAILGPASAGAPATPRTNSDFVTLLGNDLGSLPNYSSSNPAVVICWNDNGTVTSIMGTCSTLSPSAAQDPESASYIAITVDLTYTYTPFVPSFDFANFGVHLPFMPSSIHRRVMMRFI